MVCRFYDGFVKEKTMLGEFVYLYGTHYTCKCASFAKILVLKFRERAAKYLDFWCLEYIT